MAEVLRLQREAQERLEAEARRLEEGPPPSDEDPAPEEVLAAEDPEPAAEAPGIEIEELDPEDLEEHAGAFDYIEYPPPEEAEAPAPLSPDPLISQPADHRPAASLEDRLRMYEGRMIGITYGNPAEIQNIKLLAVSDDHFQVFYPISRNIVSFAYGVIISITENADGLSAVGPDISPVFPIVVELPRPFFHND